MDRASPRVAPGRVRGQGAELCDPHRRPHASDRPAGARRPGVGGARRDRHRPGRHGDHDRLPRTLGRARPESLRRAHLWRAGGRQAAALDPRVPALRPRRPAAGRRDRPSRRQPAPRRRRRSSCPGFARWCSATRSSSTTASSRCGCRRRSPTSGCDWYAHALSPEHRAARRPGHRAGAGDPRRAGARTRRRSPRARRSTGPGTTGRCRVPTGLAANLGEVDHGDRVLFGHVAVVQLAEEGARTPRCGGSRGCRAGSRGARPRAAA